MFSNLQLGWNELLSLRMNPPPLAPWSMALLTSARTSASDPKGMAEELLAGGYPEDTPVVLGYRVGWPDEKILATDLGSVADVARSSQIQRQAVFLILPGQQEDPVFSKLYNPQFSHGFRKGKE